MSEQKNEDPMRVWSKVCETDKSAVKEVNTGGRRFHAIDPTFQARKATELWGPAGGLWGPTNVTYGHEEDGDTRLVWCQLDLKHPDGLVEGLRSAEKLAYTTSRGKRIFDSEAWKKARTNAISKGLAALGFSADVFLGKFEDNSYVQARAAEEDAHAAGLKAGKDAVWELVKALPDAARWGARLNGASTAEAVARIRSEAEEHAMPKDSPTQAIDQVNREPLGDRDVKPANAPEPEPCPICAGRLPCSTSAGCGGGRTLEAYERHERARKSRGAGSKAPNADGSRWRNRADAAQDDPGADAAKVLEAKRAELCEWARHLEVEWAGKLLADLSLAESLGQLRSIEGQARAALSREGVARG